jgi:methionine-S-sulfoxide reductase
MSPATRILCLVASLLLPGCATATADGGAPAERPAVEAPSGQPLAPPAPAGMSVAIFAGGCFWCMEGPFESMDGVVEVLSGYSGGSEKNPTYGAVSRGRTSHQESVRVVYDATKVTYAALLERYWRSVDPTDGGGQFADRGTQYQPVIFYGSEPERIAAEASKAALAASSRFEKPIEVEIRPAGDFWVAEEYHQDYYRKNAMQYLGYRRMSGRSGFLARVWGSDIGLAH